LRIRAATANPTAYKITLAGVSSVRAATLDKSNYELRSGLLNISGTLNAGLQKGLDFELQDNLASLYIDAVLDNKTAEQISSTGSDIYLGAGKFNPGYAPYVLKLNLNGNNGLVSFTWDGRSQYGGYVDSGIYRCRISASGADGYGFSVTETTLNVSTPFILQDAGITPADAQFNTFSSSPNSVAVKYLTNKDGYLTAKIYDEKNNLVCTLAEKTKTLGGSAGKILFWNGACPLPESTQRKVSGNYYLNLYYQPEDNTAAKNICYNNIKIVSNVDDTIFANLAPLGEALNYNGETVQNTSGVSNYYWSARAQGKYSVPKSFTYKLEASGQQLVSVNPFVPFAALYHRGFDKVKRIKVTFYMRYYEGVAGNGYADSRNDNKAELEITSKNCINSGFYFHEEKGFGRFDQGQINVYLDNLLMASYKMNSFYGVTETYNRGVLRIKNFSASRYPDNNRNVSVLRNYDCSIQVDLLDNIKYSRLTNRYYAWYGYVNKDTGRTLDFSPWWQDLGKLGFVPVKYFSDPQFNEKLKPITSGALAVTIDGKSILYDPQTVDSAGAVLAALEKENVLYESLHCTDNSYYNYLADEYTELIPLAMPVSINYASHYLTKNMIDKCTVQTDFSRRELIAWPIDEDTIISSINNTLLAVAKNINSREIVEVDYDKLPGLTDIKSVDFGGLGSSLQEATGIVSKHKAYKQKIADVFNFSNKYNLKLKITAVSDPDIEVCFDNGLNETTVADPAGLNVLAHYKTNAGLDSIKPWSTEMDPFLKHGVIDSQALVFNADTFAPKTEYLSISDTYFNELNRPENIVSQNVYPIDYYTFQEYNYYDRNSGRVTNPNLDIEKWDVAVYDQSGGINQDLEVTDLALDNENIFNNKFKIKLKLDAIEKRLVEVKGEASGPYELLYFDGTAWQNISTCNVPAAGRLAWWDVGRKNGKYTVALKVYRDKFGMPPYNIYTTEVYIGELLRAGDNALENKRVSSPYKRAEVYFHPNSYAEDKFITVTPITLEKLNIKNKPDIYTLGPIAEILPHGSSFPDPEKRPTLVYKYSVDDLTELKKRGIDVRNLSVYYLNESGELEKANSEIASTNCGLEIRTVLSIFLLMPCSRAMFRRCQKFLPGFRWRAINR
jgi:flagellar hook assembly protein FlgD